MSADDEKARSANLIFRQEEEAQVTPQGVTPERSTDPRWMEWRRFMGLVRRALRAGAVREGPVVNWNVSASSRHPCLAPREVRAWRSARKAAVYDCRKPEMPQAMLVMWGRCRHCDACREHRRRLWIARALVEDAAAPGRSWFVTLTSNQDHREWVDRAAALASWRDRATFTHLDAARQFDYRCKVWKHELSLYLKRVRKGVGRRHRPRVRFLATVEPHKDGVAHAHLVVWEHSVDAPLTERLLRGRWASRGHASARLCDRRSVAYVAKYLAKDRWATVQASCRFGQAPRQKPTLRRRGPKDPVTSGGKGVERSSPPNTVTTVPYIAEETSASARSLPIQLDLIEWLNGGAGGGSRTTKDVNDE